MRSVGVSGMAAAVCLVFAACGQGPVELVVRGAGSEGCEYAGPTETSPGEVDLLATPAGLGEIRATIYEVASSPEGEIDVADLGDSVATVRSEDDVDLARRTTDLAPGDYAVVCQYGDFDGVVGLLSVGP